VYVGLWGKGRPSQHLHCLQYLLYIMHEEDHYFLWEECPATIVLQEAQDIVLIIFAGLPATTAPAGTSLLTMLPAPITALLPIVTPFRITAP